MSQTLGARSLPANNNDEGWCIDGFKIFLKGTSPEGQRLNKEVAQQLEGLNSEMQNAILQQEQSGVRRPANTLVGKMDQVHQWMNNPSSDPTGLGGCPVHMYGCSSSKCIL